VAFIDGLHTFEQSLRDFENCLNYLSPTGVILLHDCNPLSPEEGAPTRSPEEMYALYPNRKSNDWTGDVWKTILYLQSIPEFEVMVLDCDHGVGVVRKTIGSLPKQSLSKDQIDILTYEDLDKNRTAFLNLKQPQYIHKFLKNL
jgi:hypothetical protein